MPETRFPPPTGYPLGTNRAYKFCTRLGIPILRLITKRDWQGQENIPQTGPAIVVSNHVSYVDFLFLAQFLYLCGRAPRFIGKQSVFDLPIIGRILHAAQQIPVDRETAQAGKALELAISALGSGHLIGIYPEGTLTRDDGLWPMVAKTGAARLAILTESPVIPVAAWGTAQVLPRYSKRIHLWPRTRVTMYAGPALDLSPWYGKGEDQPALVEATAFIMQALTALLEEIRGERGPAVPLDARAAGLPRTGNFKKAKPHE